MNVSDRWSRVEALYHAARGRDADERAAFLDGACGADAELRAEVESLLAQPASGDGFLGEPAVAIAAQMITMEDFSGRDFGAYRIVGPLGEGGMAAVYKAYQPALDHHVALKILPRALAAIRSSADGSSGRRSS
jgi:serine/threonine protein kinase